MKLEVKVYNCKTDNIKITEWLPYLILAEADIADKLTEKYEYLWEMNTWETINFIEIRHPESNEIMGRCLMGLFPEYIQLFTLYVPPMFRRLGVAKTLVQYFIDYAEEFEYEYIKAGTRVSNIECNNLYQSFNFEKVGEDISKYSGQLENDYELRILNK